MNMGINLFRGFAVDFISVNHGSLIIFILDG